jgi:hypothetical protein
VTTGDIWSLDPFEHRVALAVLQGRAMGPALRAALQEQGVEVDANTPYWIAAVQETAEEGDFDFFGDPERVERTGITLRDALVREVRERGLPA